MWKPLEVHPLCGKRSVLYQRGVALWHSVYVCRQKWIYYWCTTLNICQQCQMNSFLTFSLPKASYTWSGDGLPPCDSMCFSIASLLLVWLTFLDIRAVTDFYGCVAVFGFAICMRFGNNIVLLTSKIVPNNDDILYEPILLVRYIDQITSKNISLFMLEVGFHKHKTVRPQVSCDQ